MENYNSASRYDDDESRESSSSDTSSTTRRVALPASALHGLGSHAETPKAEQPRFEDVFAAEHQRRQQESGQRAEHERKREADTEEDDTDTAVAPPSQPKQPAPQTEGESEYIDLPLPRHTEAQEAEVVPAESTSAAEVPAELSQEAVDEQFRQIVDANLHDLQNLNLPKTEQEPYALDPSVEHAAEVQPFSPAAEAAATAPPAIEQVPQDHAEDFAAWESEFTNEAEFPTPPIPPQRPAPNIESSSHPTEGSIPEGQTGTGGGNNLPPMPPFGGSGEMPAASPEPEPISMASAAERPRGFVESLANTLPAAEMLMINNKLQRAEFARRRGDAITGLVAGWALVRTFRNRNMIKSDRRENQATFRKQEQTMAEVSQQNALLQQRLNQVEQRASAPQQAMPNRFRPMGEAAPVATAAMPEATAADSRKAAEKARLAQEQYEENLRQQAMEGAPENELVRPQWLTVEVNKQTGKAVEKPTSFDYGEAFKNEQRREHLQDRMADSTAPQQQAAGPAGFLGGAPASGAAGMQSSLSAPTAQQSYIPNALPPHLQTVKPSTKAMAKSTGQQLTATVTSPWFWVAVITLLIVFFAAAWF
ncbi:MAG TPA: hypothetical protein VJR27_05355 [Candidatus Saccharimonadales bacterium]|nr:hypothetical protein [Candidatus Saccharimonadales bacterium]